MPLESGFIVVHVQLVRGAEADSAFENRLRTTLGIPLRAGRVIASPYEAFPDGMSLDYERKFAYYVAGGVVGRRGLTAEQDVLTAGSFSANADPERAPVLRNGVLQVVLGHRDGVVDVEQIADRADELERASERLDHRHVRGSCGAEPRRRSTV